MSAALQIDGSFSGRRLLAVPFVLLFLIGYSVSCGCGFAALESADRHTDQTTEMQEDEFSVNQFGVYTYEVVNEFDHDPNAFTEGLVYAGNNTFYESTGIYGSSSVRKVQVQTGKVEQIHRMERKYFGEGLTLMNQRLYQVAWRVTLGFIYDEKTLTLLENFEHPMKDGWGLATDGEVLYGSDGSSSIYVIQPSTFAEERRFIVQDQQKEIHWLNELEYVNEELWANVWMKNCIVRISPKNGQVLGWILLHGLRNDLIARGYKNIDVLNGIAWDGDLRRIFVTGKLWPKLYEIRVHPHPEDFKNREDIWKRCNV